MGRDGRTNPRAASRELRREFEKQTAFKNDLLKILNQFYGYGYMVKWEIQDMQGVCEAIDKIHKAKIEADAEQREQEKYERRRNGILRVRSWPVRCFLRTRWYKDLDGTDPFEPKAKKELSLGGGYLRLGGGITPKRKRYKY